MFISVQKLIFNTDNPLDNAKRYVPFYMFLTSLVKCLVTIKEGADPRRSAPEQWRRRPLSVAISIAVAFAGWISYPRPAVQPER